MEDEYPGEPILAAPHHYWGCCPVCHMTAKPKQALKRCGRCQTLYYCSPAHQRAHWKKHKVLCKYLADAAEAAGHPNFFSGLAGLEKREWLLFRQNAVITCSVLLARPLEMTEQEVFLFPRSCRVCHAVVPSQGGDNMLDCELCYGVTYCGQDHREQHLAKHRGEGKREGDCHQLRLARLLDQYEAMVGIGMPGFPDHLDPEYYGTADDISDFLCPDVFLEQKDGRQISKLETDWVFLTNQLSGPLTLLDQASRQLEGLAKMTELVVHVVGANVYEMMGIIKWEYLAHRLPALKRLQVSFVGPQLEGDGGDQPSDYTCEHCTKLGRSVEYLVRNCSYEQFVTSPQYTVPSLVMVQNCGFSEFEQSSEVNGWTEGWARGLPCLLSEQAPNSVLLFTSYTKGEGVKDLDRFLTNQTCKVDVLVRAEENRMRSHRPIRDWERDQDKDLFYSNQFISVVRRWSGERGEGVVGDLKKLKI